MQLIIKVCGMREPSNIAKLQELEVDWMGMIFFGKSSRNVEQPIFIKKEKRNNITEMLFVASQLFSG